MQDKKVKETNDSGDKINDFIRKNRKGIFIILGALCIMFAGIIVYITWLDAYRKNSIAEVEELSSRFNDLSFSINDENYKDEVDALLADLEAFADKNRELAAGRAYSYIARIYSGREEWSLCEEAWIKAANAGTKTYLGPIALFNVAVAAEEQGKIEQAIEYLQKSIDHPFEFPAAPRAQFNMGRLYEKNGDNQAAIEAYRAVLINWPEIPVWQHFARNAIIAIEVQDTINN